MKKAQDSILLTDAANPSKIHKFFNSKSTAGDCEEEESSVEKKWLLSGIAH